MNQWNKYEKAAEKGPMTFFWKVFFPILLIVVVLGAAGYVLSWFGEAAEVVKEEFGPRAALEKYEWFVDQANRIEKMDQDIKLFEKRVASVDEQYEIYGNPTKWDVATRSQYNQAKQMVRDDLLAVSSQRNNLVRDYNSQSEKFNWKPFQINPDKPKERFHEYIVK